MRKIQILSEEIHRMNNGYEGKFYLSNHDIIQFEISLEYGIRQWGSSKEVLWQTVERLEELQAELVEKILDEKYK